MTEGERARLDVIEAKVDTIIIKLEYNERWSADHEIRLRSVEKWKLSIPISMLIVIATIVGSVISRIH